MDQTKIQQILITILHSTVNGVALSDTDKHQITPELFASVYLLAKKHDMAHVLAEFLYQNQITVPRDLQARLQQEAFLTAYRLEQLKYTFGEICRTFEEAEIGYVPLKGSVIRPFYPQESMRTSCDIDILIHEESLEKAISSLTVKGYQCGKRNYHDVSLYAPNKVHLELHFNILESMDQLDVVLKHAWEHAVPEKGTRYGFSEEFFAFHMFAHMAYHFVHGGCGIRSLLDIWVMEHKMNIPYSCAKKLLKKAGIYQFAAEMSKLAELCFTENDSAVFSDPVLKYIFQGGVYGSMENHIAVTKTRNKSSLIYAIKRIFLPYKSMTITYPVLKKAPYLLPFCWVARWIRLLRGGKTRQMMTEMTCATNISDERIQEVAAIRSRLGL